MIHLNPSPSDIVPNESNPVNTRTRMLSLWRRLDRLTGQLRLSLYQISGQSGVRNGVTKPTIYNLEL